MCFSIRYICLSGLLSKRSAAGRAHFGLSAINGHQLQIGFLAAYAKPVPFNPYNLRNQRWGPALVGLAGPMANLLLAASCATVVRLLPGSIMEQFLLIIVYANVLLMVFNLVPIPPLDGS